MPVPASTRFTDWVTTLSPTHSTTLSAATASPVLTVSASPWAICAPSPPSPASRYRSSAVINTWDGSPFKNTGVSAVSGTVRRMSPVSERAASKFNSRSVSLR